MINSLKDLINESLEPKDGLVDEMGVKKPERLSGSQMGNIRRETVQRREQMANQPQARSYNQVAGELETALRSVRRLDITMEKPANSRNYYPRFPQNIVDLMTELSRIDSSRFQRDFGTWRDLSQSDSAIHFRTEGPSDYQRSHFPNNGIPESLRGTGLGYKLYRTLLKFAGYISSNTSGTREKDKAWGSMLTYKSNPDGTPSEDDAHAIIGPSNWMAIDKGTLRNDKKVEIAMNFITNQIGLSRTQADRFDIDDELLALLPDTFLTRLDSSYLNGLVQDDRLTGERRDQIVAARTEAERAERERAQREETERRERQAREEAATRQRLADRLEAFGADPDAEWSVGDFIVVKSYLYDANYTSLPIRRVVTQDNRNYVAVKVADAMRIDRGDITWREAGDTRTTSDKTQWVKVNLERIPNLNAVNLSSEEIRYVQSLLDPAEIARRQEAERTEREAQTARDREANTNRNDLSFDNLPTTVRDLKNAVLGRSSLPNIDLLKKARSGNFVKFVVLTSTQNAQFRSDLGIPVFAAIERIGRAVRSVESPSELIDNPRNIVLVNLVTGQEIQGPFVGLGLVAYTLDAVTEEDKLRARAGDHYYIANHLNNYGILAKCDYTTRNTSNQPFIYLRAFGFVERPTPVRLDLLRKIVGEPIQIQ